VKTGLLLPGKSQTITFAITASDLASFDEKTSSWVAEAGAYIVKIGASSTDIRQTKTCKPDKDLVAGKVSKALSPQVEINELKRP
jgi:beta-glucosidase